MARKTEVLGIGRRPWQGAPKGLDYRVVDYSDEAALSELFREIDCVVHSAGMAGVWGRYEDFASANIGVTDCVLRAAQTAGVKRFINIGTPSIYFQYRDQLNLSEQDVPSKMVGYYAQTKYIAEQKVLEANSSSFLTLSLRPRGIIGAGDRAWMPAIIERAREGKLVQVGSGSNLANFTCIDNLTELIGSCKNAPESAFGEAYNINDGEEVEIWSAIRRVLEGVGIDSQRLRKMPYPVAITVARILERVGLWLGQEDKPRILPLEVGYASFSLTMSIDKAREGLGYQPKYGFADGVRQFLDSIQD